MSKDKDDSEDSRRHMRVEINNIKPLHVEVGGRPHSLIVTDISQGGVGFVLPSGTSLNPDDVMSIGIEQVVSLRGRVRWATPVPGEEESTRLGVEFQTLTVHPKSGEEIQEMVNAWMNISHSYNVFDSFLQIVDLIDNDILDGNIAEFSDAVLGIAMWIEQQVGAINVWQTIDSGERDLEAHLLVKSPSADDENHDERAQRVVSVATNQVTEWYDGIPYVYSERMVIECLEKFDGKIDLLHKLANVLGKRLRMWTKLLSQNIALRFLGEELDRYRSHDKS